VRVRVNRVKTDLWHPDNNSYLSLKAKSAQMRYLFEGMTWDAGAFSSEKVKCGVKGEQNVYQKKKQDWKSGKTVFMGVLRKKLKHTVIQKYFFLDILINVKAGRVN
jgi:hypothetical protein